MSLLDVRDMRVYYKTKKGIAQAVDGVSFSVEPGQSLGLVGESGCGKSTMVNGIIRVMAKNAFIPSGEVLFDGQDLTLLPEKEMRNVRWRDLSLIPQAAMDSLNPVYPVEDAFTEVLTLKGNMTKKEAHARTVELFTMVGLDPDRLGNFPHEYSGGMKQRAAIALALALEPRLVIADEPVTALDVIVQRQVLNELKRLRSELNLALIMITHDISVVAETCDNIVVMYAGKVVEKGSTQEVLENPLHPYTMGLENAFPDPRQQDKELISIEGSPPDLVNPPSGCRFAPRCPFAMERCLAEEPPYEEVDEEHQHGAACFRLSETLKLQKLAKEVETWQPA
ncbi:MAG TPA: ABC transporter ATP-binding protein [Firmicutes bacterium]|nr:ABC transporter ATP-binding protein [Bacillota bacterium]